MVFYFYKKIIAQWRMKLSVKTNLTVIYAFHRVNQICMEFCSGNKTFTVKKHLCDENGRILILETLIEFILINLYNANTVGEQIKMFNELNTLQ